MLESHYGCSKRANCVRLSCVEHPQSSAWNAFLSWNLTLQRTCAFQPGCLSSSRKSFRPSSPRCPLFLQHGQAVALHDSMWTQTTRMIIQVLYVFRSPLQRLGLMLPTCPPQNPAHLVAIDMCFQRDNKVLEDQLMGFLSLLYICCTQFWGRCAALVNGLGRVVRNGKGQISLIHLSWRKGMRTFSILLMFCTVDQHWEAFLGSLREVDSKSNLYWGSVTCNQELWVILAWLLSNYLIRAEYRFHIFLKIRDDHAVSIILLTSIPS